MVILKILYSYCFTIIGFLFLSISSVGSEKINSSNEFIDLGSNFEFGVASAPGHVEDQLNDMWLEFAQNNKIPGWKEVGLPDERTKFWSHPEVELDLAKELGVTTYRLGIDWSRLVPKDPIENSVNSEHEIQDMAALMHYKDIIKMIRSRGMKVMLTLFHHSFPLWAINRDGFADNEVKRHFFLFAKDVLTEVGDDVDYLITFNEPSALNLFVYIAGIWPQPKSYTYKKFHFPEYIVSENNMKDLHNDIYNFIKSKKNTMKIQVGSSNNYFYSQISSKYDLNYFNFLNHLKEVIVRRIQKNIVFNFLSGTINHSDFIGVNYYGAEISNENGQLFFSPNYVYSESGRAISPKGLLKTLNYINDNFNKTAKPFYITENGIADAEDIVRPSYLLEHLKALQLAQKNGLKILGYIFWTLSDNWEWADGYCPKFGLTSVDRSTHELKRIKRKSFDLYRTVITNHGFTQKIRDFYWNQYQLSSGEQLSCRASDAVSALATPRKVLIDKKIDWRL